MTHHLKSCLEDSSPDNIILYHGTNNAKSDDNSEKISSDIVSLGLSAKNEKAMVYISSLVIRNDKLDEKGKEVNDFIKQHALPIFIDNENINLGMLNRSGLDLNENGTNANANVSAIFMDLSKAFGTLNHNLLKRLTFFHEKLLKR